jgi:hypothetical protein
MNKIVIPAMMAAVHLIVFINIPIIGWGLLAPTLVSSANSIAVVMGFATAIATGFLAILYAITATYPAINLFMEKLNNEE